MDFVVRLKEYMVLCGITSTQFADKAGIPRPTLSQILNGRNKTINNEIISKIHNAFPEMNISWLLFGDGEPGVIPKIETSEPENNKIEALTSNENSDEEPVTDLFSFSSMTMENNSNNKSKTDNRSEEDKKKISFSNSGSNTQEADIHEVERELDKNALNEIGMQNSSGRASIPFNPSGWQQQAPNRLPQDSKSRKVTSIMVFYSDNSYETFIPA